MEIWRKDCFDTYVTPSDEALVLQVAKHYFPRYDEQMQKSFEESQELPKPKHSTPSERSATATTLGKSICEYREFFWLANQARKGPHHSSWANWLQNQASIKRYAKMKPIDWSLLLDSNGGNDGNRGAE